MFKEQAEHYLREKEATMFYSEHKKYDWDEVKEILNDLNLRPSVYSVELLVVFLPAIYLVLL